jgi:hypothetical protein
MGAESGALCRRFLLSSHLRWTWVLQAWQKRTVLNPEGLAHWVSRSSDLKYRMRPFRCHLITVVLHFSPTRGVCCGSNRSRMNRDLSPSLFHFFSTRGVYCGRKQSRMNIVAAPPTVLTVIPTPYIIFKLHIPSPRQQPLGSTTLSAFHATVLNHLSVLGFQP